GGGARDILGRRNVGEDNGVEVVREFYSAVHALPYGRPHDGARAGRAAVAVSGRALGCHVHPLLLRRPVRTPVRGAGRGHRRRPRGAGGAAPTTAPRSSP